MKKSWLVVFTLLILCVATANARTDLFASDKHCYNDGSVVIHVENTKLDSIYLDNARVTYRYEGEREEHNLTGSWDKDEIYSTAEDKDLRYAVFTSDQGQLEKSGDYYIRIYYSGCGASQCIEAFTLEECNGYTQYCKRYAPVAESCTNRNTYFYFKFTVPERKDAYSVNQYNDYQYYFDSNKRDVDGPRKIEDSVIERIDDFTYQLKVPLKTGEKIDDAAVTHYMCDTEVLINNKVECGDMVVALPPPEPEPIVAEENEYEIIGEALEQVEEVVAEPEPIVEETEEIEVVEEEPFTLPIHFYVLLGMVVLGILLIVLSNTNLFGPEPVEEKPKKKKAKRKKK